jgi:membrane peptidoglycan carboxypeptidase
LELAAAYGALANGGHYVQPIAIHRVEDTDGNLLWSAGLGVGSRVLDARVAYLISDILSDNVARIPSFGEESVLRLSRPAAVKTGTTTDFRDNWTVGYTPLPRGLVVGVWTGNADNEPMHDISGLSGAAPIWYDFMDTALRGRPIAEFEQPGGLVEAEVCALSGLLPEMDCPHRVTELFIKGTEPTESCTMHQRIAIDRATGLRATADTPPKRVVERLYTILPLEAQDWAREQGISQPPPVTASGWPVTDSGSAIQYPVSNAQSPLLMSSPDAGAVYRLDPGLPYDAQRIVIAVRPGTVESLVEVMLLVDGQPLARFGAPPYQALWRLEVGRHDFSAEGMTISGGRVTSDKVWVEVRK